MNQSVNHSRAREDNHLPPADRSSGRARAARACRSRENPFSRSPWNRPARAWTLALALLAGCGMQNPAQDPGVCAKPTQAEDLAEQLFRLINMERTLEDLEPLAWDEQLAKVATGYACRIVEGKFFGHVDPETWTGPDDRLTSAGYEFLIMGENLALGQPTALEVLDDWMESPAHRDNLLSREWTHVAIGVRTDQDGVPYWVLEFATPVPEPA